MRAHDFISEIFTTDDFIDSSSIENMNLNYDHSGKNAKHITDLGASTKLYATNWPLKASNVFYFKNANGDVVGEAFVSDQSVKGFNNVFTVDSIYLKPELRGQNIGYLFYSLLLNNRYKIMSDEEHTSHSKKLWKRLAGSFKVDTLDLTTGTLITDPAIDVYDTNHRLIAQRG